MTDILCRIIGSELALVSFVRNYVQLGFDGPGDNATLSVFARHHVAVGGRRYSNGSAGYRDALCDRIGQIVMAVQAYSGEILIVRFQDESTLEVSLVPTDALGQESAILEFKDTFEVWREEYPKE